MYILSYMYVVWLKLSNEDSITRMEYEVGRAEVQPISPLCMPRTSSPELSSPHHQSKENADGRVFKLCQRGPLRPPWRSTAVEALDGAVLEIIAFPKTRGTCLFHLAAISG